MSTIVRTGFWLLNLKYWEEVLMLFVHLTYIVGQSDQAKLSLAVVIEECGWQNIIYTFATIELYYGYI